GVFVPGTYDDHPFTIGPNDGDAALHAKITWADATINDWDLYLLKAGGTTPIASSAQGGTTSEELALPNPDPGDYVLRIVNYTAVGSVDANVTFDQRTQAIASKGSSSYVGYCGYCDTITQGTPFGNGIATNVGGDKPGLTGSPDGWHIAAAKGLPSRYITSVRMDPENPRTVYVTLAGYGRRWAFPGAVGEDTSKVGTGHVFKSTDAGATFTNVTGNLPDIPANWSLIHNGHLVVGTDIGVFESCDTAGGQYATLGSGLPTSPVSTLRYKPGDPNTILAATYGRGPFTYTFSDDNGRCPAADGSPGTTPTPTPSPTPTSTPNGNGNGDGSGACPASSGFKRARVKPAGAGLRFAITRRVMAAYKVDVFRSAAGRTVGRPVLVKRFRNRTGPFTWKGRAGLPSGIYFTRAKVRSGSTADTRRSVFAYRHGRFHARPQFSARASCKLLGSARLGSPAFGGTSAAPLRIAFRLIKPASVTVRATQGSKTLLGRTLASGAKGYTRLRLPARRAHRGRVVVRISARAGSVRESVRLVSLRL
ncbi:MAG: hypothetical protein QOF76_4094, partial [Solirubrobacteraceae bacterium]|nr:hypothetical protein [Solirubrobacteraceae bacterium]